MRKIDYAHLAAYTLTICFGIFVLYLFAGIWTSDTLLVYEDNLVIRGIETAISVGFVLFGLWGVTHLMRLVHREQSMWRSATERRGKGERFKYLVIGCALLAVMFMVGATGSWIVAIVAIIMVFIAVFAFRRDIRQSLTQNKRKS